MARRIEGDSGSEVRILTTEDNAAIGENRMSIRVTSERRPTGERGPRGQMPLSQGQALELAAALLETVRGQGNIS